MVHSRARGRRARARRDVRRTRGRRMGPRRNRRRRGIAAVRCRKRFRNGVRDAPSRRPRRAPRGGRRVRRAAPRHRARARDPRGRARREGRTRGPRRALLRRFTKENRKRFRRRLRFRKRRLRARGVFGICGVPAGGGVRAAVRDSRGRGRRVRIARRGGWRPGHGQDRTLRVGGDAGGVVFERNRRVGGGCRRLFSRKKRLLRADIDVGTARRPSHGRPGGRRVRGVRREVRALRARRAPADVRGRRRGIADRDSPRFGWRKKNGPFVCLSFGALRRAARDAPRTAGRAEKGARSRRRPRRSKDKRRDSDGGATGGASVTPKRRLGDA